MTLKQIDRLMFKALKQLRSRLCGNAIAQLNSDARDALGAVRYLEGVRYDAICAINARNAAKPKAKRR